MQIGFVCPDGETIKFEECLKKCRMASRCLTLPTLMAISKTRKWTGTPSVTQCLNGTMEAYLKITVPYFINPQRYAFALLGTDHHKNLERAALPAEVFGEEQFKEEGLTGQVDLLDGRVLTDYKTWGSYKVAKALGYYYVSVPTGEFYKSGAKKGQEKFKKELRQSPDKIDMIDAIYQLNRYRIFFEKAGFPIEKMQIQATVRDGGTYIAFSRGVKNNIYLIDVPRVDDEIILEYFSRKGSALVKCVSTKTPPADPCTPEERWEDRKCKSFCEVAASCPHGQVILASVEETEEGA